MSTFAIQDKSNGAVYGTVECDTEREAILALDESTDAVAPTEPGELVVWSLTPEGVKAWTDGPGAGEMLVEMRDVPAGVVIALDLDMPS